MTPCGVQETSCARPLISKPALVGVRASTSFSGSSVSSTGRFPDLWRQRQLHQDAMHGRIVVQRSNVCQHIVLAGIFRQREMQRFEPDIPRGFCPYFAHRLRWQDRCRQGRSQGRAPNHARPSTAQLPRRCARGAAAATALPSIIRAARSGIGRRADCRRGTAAR